MKSNKRFNFLINPRFQLRFISFMVFTGAAVASVFYASLEYFFHKLNSLGTQFALPADNPFFVFIAQQHMIMNRILILSFSIMFCLIVLFGLIYSHRIAGPIKRLQGEMSRLKSLQDFKNFKFRKGDFFQELPAEFSGMVNRLNKK